MTVAIVHADGWLVCGRHRLRAAIGRAGVTLHKQEGDGATPAGLMALRRVMYRADRLPVPAAAVPREPIGARDGWCDDPAQADYNRRVTLPHPGSAEELWRSDPLYDIVGVLDWNLSPVQPGGGSAIFLHVARPDLSPTDGCVALPLPDLLELLRDGLTAIDVRPEPLGV